MKTLEQPWQQLLKVEELEGAKAWGEFLFNIPAAREFVAQVSKEAVSLALSQGQKWNGMGWTTSRASRVVYELTGVPLVSSKVEEYRDAFLFALAMTTNVEVLGLDLGDRASEVAYYLCGLIANPESVGQSAAQPATGEPEPDSEAHQPEEPLSAME